MTDLVGWLGFLVGGGVVVAIALWRHDRQPDPAIAHMEAEAVELKQQVDALQQQCFRLREDLQHQKGQLTIDIQDSCFEYLQTLLTNYPTARQMAQMKPDLPAKSLVALFTPVDNLLQAWGIEPIGVPWEAVAFNPQLHQPDGDDVQVGETVYVRFIGYRQGDRILCPARVSRTLPAGIQQDAC